MSHEPLGERIHRSQKRNVILPEAMRRMAQIGPQQVERIGNSKGVRGEGGVRDDTDKRAFSERAGCPSLSSMTSKPLLDFLVSLMRRPCSRDKNIYIQQEIGAHSSSSSSLRTCSVVTGGDPAGKSTT